MHYHVKVNDADQGWAYVAHERLEAQMIVNEREVRAIDSGYSDSDTVEIVECHEGKACGSYLDLLSFEAYSREISTDDVILEREYSRMILESDGHGPV